MERGSFFDASARFLGLTSPRGEESINGGENSSHFLGTTVSTLLSPFGGRDDNFNTARKKALDTLFTCCPIANQIDCYWTCATYTSLLASYWSGRRTTFPAFSRSPGSPHSCIECISGRTGTRKFFEFSQTY